MTRCASTSSCRNSSARGSSATAAAAPASKLPRKTPRRRKNGRSSSSSARDQSRSRPRSRCRSGRSSGSSVSVRARSTSRAICGSVGRPSCPAASSMSSGIPSVARQIAATCAALASFRAKWRTRCLSCSTQSCTLGTFRSSTTVPRSPGAGRGGSTIFASIRAPRWRSVREVQIRRVDGH